MNNEKTKTFAEFLYTIKDENTPASDFARDFIASNNPAEAYAQVKEDLATRFPSACDGAIRSMESANRRHRYDHR